MKGCSDLFYADPTLRPRKWAMKRRAARVYRALRVSSRPLPAFVIAESAGMDTGSVRTHLDRMVDDGIVLKVSAAPEMRLRARTTDPTFGEIDDWQRDQIARKRARDTMRATA